MADGPTANPNPGLDDPRLAPVVNLYAQRATERAHPRNPERYKAKVVRDVSGGDVCRLLAERPSARAGQIVDLLESGQYSTTPAGPAGEDRGPADPRTGAARFRGRGRADASPRGPASGPGAVQTSVVPMAFSHPVRQSVRDRWRPRHREVDDRTRPRSPRK